MRHRISFHVNLISLTSTIPKRFISIRGTHSRIPILVGGSINKIAGAKGESTRLLIGTLCRLFLGPRKDSVRHDDKNLYRFV